LVTDPHQHTVSGVQLHLVVILNLINRVRHLARQIEHVNDILASIVAALNLVDCHKYVCFYQDVPLKQSVILEKVALHLDKAFFDCEAERGVVSQILLTNF
jgi:hypothetical protein